MTPTVLHKLQGAQRCAPTPTPAATIHDVAARAHQAHEQLLTARRKPRAA